MLTLTYHLNVIPMKKSRTLPFMFVAAMAIVQLSFGQQADVSHIGKIIPEQQAHQWTAQFKVKHPKDLQGYFVGKTMLHAMLSSTDVAGLFILNAIDDHGGQLFVYSAATNQGVAKEPFGDTGLVCPPHCPWGGGGLASVGSFIDADKSSRWQANYATEFPSRPASYLFGKNVVQDILSQSRVAGLMVMNALNDRGELCVLLVGVNENGQMMWDRIGEDGLPCPERCNTIALGTAIAKR